MLLYDKSTSPYILLVVPRIVNNYPNSMNTLFMH